MTNFLRFSLFFVIAMCGVIDLHAAVVRLAVDFDTDVTFFGSDGSKTTLPVRKNTGGLFGSFVYDAFFKNGPSVGINKIQWVGPDGQLYEAILDLKPGLDSVSLHITNNNTLTDQDPFSAYFNKIFYRVLP